MKKQIQENNCNKCSFSKRLERCSICNSMCVHALICECELGYKDCWETGCDDYECLDDEVS